MSDQQPGWSPRLPVTDLTVVSAAGGGPGVSAVIRDGLDLAAVMARKGASSELAGRIRTLFGLELPAGPRCAAAADLMLIGTAPGAWLAVADRGGSGLAAALQRELAGLAAVTDQSDGYFMVRLSGPRVRETLAKLVPIDVHARAFAVADAASTVLAHIGVTMWRREDAPGAMPVFEIVLFRSLAKSFWHALAEAAAEFGFVGRGA